MKVMMPLVFGSVKSSICNTGKKLSHNYNSLTAYEPKLHLAQLLLSNNGVECSPLNNKKNNNNNNSYFIDPLGEIPCEQASHLGTKGWGFSVASRELQHVARNRGGTRKRTTNPGIHRQMTTALPTAPLSPDLTVYWCSSNSSFL